MTTRTAPKRTHAYLAALVAGTVILAGCSAASTVATTETSSPAITEPAGTASSSDSTASSDSAAAQDVSAPEDTSGTLFDPDVLHTVSIDIPADTLTDVLQTYADSGDKKWAKATVTIDGATFTDVGIKLKGNSSLRGVTASSKAESLPWRIRLDKYVDGQNLGGYTDFTIRGSSTATAMNEAVALDLLGDAGLATEQAAETRFSVNGSAATLRLAVQNLDETWVEQNFPDAGADSILYKSDADGDWSWRGEDGDYTSSFEIEAGPDDYAPLIALLDLLNNGTDAEKAEKLPDLVDLDSFATYLAFEDLIGNFDDIDGPGNNSYLMWDSATKKFTIVAWDHNLAFGSGPGAGGQGAFPGGGQGGQGGMRPGGQGGTAQNGTGQGGTDNTGDASGNMPALPDGFTPPTDLPEGFTPPTDGALPTDGFPAPGGDGQQGDGQGGAPNGRGGRGGMPGGKSNPLVNAFNAVTDWTALKTAATQELQQTLIDSGARDESVAKWEKLLTGSATDLVSADTIAKEADTIRDFTATS